MAIYDPQDKLRQSTVDNHVATNHKIYEHIYNFSIVSDITTKSANKDDVRVIVWDGGITEYLHMFNGVMVYHRTDGPAVDSLNPDFIAFYVHGDMYVDTKEYCEACGFDEVTTMVYVMKNGDELPYF